MIKPPSLIILNGPYSAGKTTISKVLQDLLPSTNPNVLLGIDAYHLAIPPSKLSLATADPNYFIPHVIEGEKKQLWCTDLILKPLIVPVIKLLLVS